MGGGHKIVKGVHWWRRQRRCCGEMAPPTSSETLLMRKPPRHGAAQQYPEALKKLFAGTQSISVVLAR